MNFLYPIIFSTSDTAPFGKMVCSELKKRLPQKFLPKKGKDLEGKATFVRFSNENLQVAVENVRDHFAIIIHTQAPPVSEGLMELIALLDAIVRADPAKILVVFPYMPCSRSDRKDQARISVMGQRLPEIINGFKEYGIPIKTLLLDPHDSHIKHYFKPNSNEITAMHLLAIHIKKHFNLKNTVIVFPDNGAAKKFEDVAHFLGLDVAYIDKRRNDNKEKPTIRKIIGDVKGKICILIDDEGLTGGTLIMDAEALYEEGAEEVSIAVIHPIFEKKGEPRIAVIRKIEDSPIVKAIVSNTVPIEKKLKDANAKKFIIVDSSPLIAEAIKRIICSQSLSELHDTKNLKFYCK
jgi:ribose-phosphate pyrophosphokinase